MGVVGLHAEDAVPESQEPARALYGSRWRAGLYLGVAALVVIVATRVSLRSMEHQALDEARAIEGEAGGGVGPMQAARVLGSIRRLKLVTVELASHANAQSGEESWRGDVRASVDAPVKLHYGTDLARLRADGVRVGPLGNSWVITVPAPERVATEVFGEREQTDVRVGWMRSRAVAGEKHLGLARRDLYDAARRLALSQDQMERVRGQTREQVALLVRSIVGPWANVSVRFEDEAPPETESRQTAIATPGDSGNTAGAEGAR
jgi:hypothetical protein